MNKTGKKKKTMSMAHRAVLISVTSSVFLVLVCILVSALFFQREAIKIYEGMETSLTRSALVEVDHEVLNDLIIKTAEVVKTIDDPVSMRENSEEEYFAKFAEIQNSEEYKKIWEELNNTRRATISTAYCLSLIYPDRGYWVYVMDASDSNVQRCGELLIDDFLHLPPCADVVGGARLKPSTKGEIPERVAWLDRAVHPFFMHEGFLGQFAGRIVGRIGIHGIVHRADSIGTRCQHHHCTAESEGGGEHPAGHSFHILIHFASNNIVSDLSMLGAKIMKNCVNETKSDARIWDIDQMRASKNPF